MSKFPIFKSIDYFEYKGKTVLLRVDINSPIDKGSKKIVNDNRIRASIPTIKDILDKGAKLAIIAHQGDTLDYHNLISMEEHTEYLSKYLEREVKYIDDVCGPAACEAVKSLKEGEAILLGNLRYLTEEVSTFENSVKQEPQDMLNTYLVRRLAPLMDYYVNDAFAAVHRNSPSMVAFAQILPTAAGRQFISEVSALTKVMQNPDKPSVFVLGGAKISDAYGMMEQVLSNGTADRILACGVTGLVMLMAKGIKLGAKTEKSIFDRGLDKFIESSIKYLADYPDKIEIPIDLAYEEDGQRVEISILSLPCDFEIMDIGEKTIKKYETIILDAGNIFTNGPAGVYERDNFNRGTSAIMNAIADTKGFSVIGGGDTVTAANKFCDITKFNYVCTGGGAMVRFLSGVRLPLIETMKKHSV